MKYVEYCAGIGGTRAGLAQAGWKCVLAVDHNHDAVSVHRLAHGDALEADVTDLTAHDIPGADLWVAGFPCQPFSSSGNRLGFGHRSGNVFEHLARLMKECQPRIVILENVMGLLSNKSGHTFATILLSLTRMGYVLDWLAMDLQWFGVPQSRSRLFVVAAQPGALGASELPQVPGVLPGTRPATSSIFSEFLVARDLTWVDRSAGSLAATTARLQPMVGKALPPGRNAFGSLGHAFDDQYVSYDVIAPIPVIEAGRLAGIVAPEFRFSEAVRSVRYWSPEGGGGPQGMHIREESIAHCVGTSLGGAPLFAAPLKLMRRDRDRAAFLEFANWHREQDGMLIMRLRPERAVLLFGPHTERLYESLRAWQAGATRKYVLVGNMVAPVAARSLAETVSAVLSVDRLSEGAPIPP